MVTRLRHITWYFFGFWLISNDADYGPCDKQRLEKDLCQKLTASTLLVDDTVSIDPRLKSIGERQAVRAIWRLGVLWHVYAFVMTADGAKKKPSLVPKYTRDVRRTVRTWAGTSVTPEIVATVEGGAQDEQAARNCNDIQSADLGSGFLPPPCIVWSDTFQILLPGLVVGREYVAYFAARAVPQLLCRADLTAQSSGTKDLSDMQLCLGKMRNGSDLSIGSLAEKTMHKQVFRVNFTVTKDDGIGWITTWTPPPGYHEHTPVRKKGSKNAGAFVVVVIVVFLACVLVGCYVKKRMSRGGFARFNDDSVPPDAVGAQMQGGVE
eukprot:gnl/MRDRNA2_/MRDRNA2_105872_c0_seq1.p1 gnl/MRDRNA2_/MRDRNA2_105872_c0~~gnl/MRDRNA2_/MRDRNA2_105872_c0_seq1.p1  ORF type:complete len:322 (+),score=42.49 gnl/MRDRNA2_/MRDRNA2_105872_c0_seq1:51-1016(+)